MRAAGDPRAEEEYVLGMGSALRFSSSDKAVSFVETFGQEPDPFASQYLNYLHVLESDYVQCATVYSCIESAEYRDKDSGRYLDDEEALALAEQVPNEANSTRTKFKFAPNVEIMPIYRESVRVLWRPSLSPEGVWSWDNDNIDEEIMQEQIAKVEGRFPELKFKDMFGRMTHSPKCNYDPYEEIYSQYEE